jgi:predicted HicB family RNase H-like nuclease
VPRPKIHEHRVTTAVRLPPDLHDRLRRAAEERQVSVNYLIQKSLEDYLQRLIPIDEIDLTR